MADKITVSFKSGSIAKYDKGTSLLLIGKERQQYYESSIVAAKVNNDIKNLSYKLSKDCYVDFLDLTTTEGIKIYQRSLTFVLHMAVVSLYPAGKLTVEHSLSKGLYCEIHLERALTENDVNLLQRRMADIIAGDYPIVKKGVPIQSAIELFQCSGQREKVRLLKQLSRKRVSLYYCQEIYDYFYGEMVPSTGYLADFALHYYKPGLVLLFPEKENPHTIPAFISQPKLFSIFRETEEWGKILECGYVGTLNECIRNGKAADLIRISEALHEKKTAQIADFIAQHKEEVRIILIAGPSSSGKTTFAQRLTVQLRVNGVKPVSISLDDYFIDRDRTPRDENGEYDFESIDALDLELFNQDLVKLLDSQTVELPTYNFLTGTREYKGNIIKISRQQPLIIEGIHGLNERLTQAIPKSNKIKIYISALTQLSLDDHNRIPTTDGRLLRRIVRDSQFRGHDAIQTLRMWSSVRRGEEKNIFPFQEEADVMFNSALIYELAILKKYAQPLLAKVRIYQPEYSEAKRLLDFLESFDCVDDFAVPANSILREFIGNTCFQ